jgi:hypothetical protein
MLRKGPKNLSQIMMFWSNHNDMVLDEPIRALFDQIASSGPNSSALNILAAKMHEWDNHPAEDWAQETAPHTTARRARIVELLGLVPSDALILEQRVPMFTRTQRATVIASTHEQWYWQRKASAGHFYWDAYVGQLSGPGGGFSGDAISALSASTDDVVSRLSDPQRSELYGVKGLVMGYVQSGKTAHFTGVIAKAADAGYRLVIVLAGTLNILRRQTQRRIDKSLVGKEILGTEEYGTDSDWESFVSHGGMPSEKGAPDWERLTGRDDDYISLGTRLGALQFNKINPTLPFNAKANLDAAPIRLVVIKKNPTNIGRLTADLLRLRGKATGLDEVPTLVIDDESDQASINVLKPDAEGKALRTATNDAIVKLLLALPRSQYVGYTATPFANVFVDPSDAEQLFPKDFIISLPRPEGYMGVAAFVDLDADADGDGPNKRAYVREVVGLDTNPENLVKAIDSFVIAGAIKLFRMHREPDRFHFRHHTMLVHHAAVKIVHEAQAKVVEQLFADGTFTSPTGLKRLDKLFINDFVVHRDSTLPFPKDFSALKDFVAKCIYKLKADKPVRIVNGDEKFIDDTPDFDSAPVWAILVGGTKLSRGYTVEGLTTTYYRRLVGAGDTLMQMGRWFGFRKGYVDTVRWFVGTKENKQPLKAGTRKRQGRVPDMSSEKYDIYAQFGALFQDEEAFREELTRYADGGHITPAQVPPLVHSHLPFLRPTAKNKMYNAVLEYKNLGGQWKEKTMLSDEHAFRNGSLTEALLSSANATKVSLGLDGSELEAFCGTVAPNLIFQYLQAFAWTPDGRSDQNPIHWELAFLGGAHGSPDIDDWLVLVPQLEHYDSLWPDPDEGPLGVVRRGRISEDGRFKVFSVPQHRAIAEFIAGVYAGTDPNDALRKLRAKRRAVLVIYLVRPRDDDAAPVSVGFGIQFPESSAEKRVTWRLKDSTAKDAVVITI